MNTCSLRQSIEKRRMRSSSYEQIPLSEPLPQEDLEQGGVEVFLLKVSMPRESVRTNLESTGSAFKRQFFGKEIDEGKNVRLIFSGKMLTDDKTLKELGVREKSSIHVSISDFVGSLVPLVTDPEADVPSLEEDDARLARELADLERSFEFSPAHFVERDGHQVEFFLGFIIGYLIGPLMLIWVWQPRVSRRLKLGILIGVGCSIGLSLFRSSNHSSHPPPSRPSSSPAEGSH